MLQAAAQKGVKVNIIIYKEVTQALTRKYLSPTLPKYLHSLLPRSIDPITRTLSGLGVAGVFASLEQMEAQNPLITPPSTVSSSHTKHALEDLHPNISVFRHPDHLPDAQTLESSFLSSLQNLSLTAATVSKLPADTLKSIYGMNNDVILYWAHHEKLCIIDGSTTFMGGLDLCYGRWDTNQHSIADAHPGNLENIVFPGQDFNNARIMDFQDVANWENNKLDRKESSRMGWSDVSISLRGPVVEDLRAHFVERWNFIYNEKYDVRKDVRYSKLTFKQNMVGIVSQQSPTPQNFGRPAQAFGPSSSQPYERPPQQHSGNLPNIPQNSQNQTQSPPMYFPPPPMSDRGIGSLPQDGRHVMEQKVGNLRGVVRERVMEGVQHVQDQYLAGNEHQSRLYGRPQEAGIPCQIVRSCTRWSHGVPTEHSVANAYISIIQNSQHFVYIENQFFITATSESQRPVRNRIGAALVERILRAARAGERYKVIVVMPAIPGFAGDLKDESSLGTRAIMQYQYNSISRGGYSIMEMVAKEGYDPTEYIRFYNLRNYDRINSSASMREAEQKSGVDYEDARREHDDMVDPAGFRAQGGVGDGKSFSTGNNYQRYQQAASRISDRKGLGSGRWDSVSECYMLGGQDIREVPWEDGDLPEMDAFVSEELYIHTKVVHSSRIMVRWCSSIN